MPEVNEGKGENASPEYGAPEHVQQNLSSFGAQHGSQDGSDNGAEQNRGKKGNATHPEPLPDLNNAAAFFIKDRFLLHPAVLSVVFRNCCTNYAKKQNARHHAGHGKAKGLPER